MLRLLISHVVRWTKIDWESRACRIYRIIIGRGGNLYTRIPAHHLPPVHRQAINLCVILNSLFYSFVGYLFGNGWRLRRYSASSKYGLPIHATDRHSKVLLRHEQLAVLAFDIYGSCIMVPRMYTTHPSKFSPPLFTAPFINHLKL